MNMLKREARLLVEVCSPGAFVLQDVKQLKAFFRILSCVIEIVVKDASKEGKVHAAGGCSSFI